MQFKFKTKPLEHQLKIFEESKDRREYALLCDMGTGKSKITIDTVAHLFAEGRIDKWICLAPNGIYKNWPLDQIPAHWPDELNIDMRIWKERKNIIKCTNMDDVRVLQAFFINIEALQYKKGQDAIKKFCDKRTIVTVDESTTIKNPRAKRTKVVTALGLSSGYRRILSGYPTPNNQADLFSQFYFLNPNIFGYRSFYAFKNNYCVIKTVDLGPGRPKFDKIVGPKNIDELKKKMAPYTARVRKSECLDLPEKTYVSRLIDMGPEQREVYDAIKHNAIAVIENEALVTVDLVLTQLVRLHQICCGFVIQDDGLVKAFKNNPKLTELKTVLDETSDKVIVWCNYVHNILELKKELSDEYGAENICCYYGGTSQRDREESILRFQHGGAKIFLANPATAGFGLTLTASSTTVYFSNSYNLEHRLQSEDRNHRIGQRNSVLYVDLVAANSVDEKITKALINKKKIGDDILGDEWRQWL